MTALLHPVPERIVGVACLLFVVIQVLPIRFGNILPAFALGISSSEMASPPSAAGARRLEAC
jgi:hypothetical protein